jgi:hypothetical protein
MSEDEILMADILVCQPNCIDIKKFSCYDYQNEADSGAKECRIRQGSIKCRHYTTSHMIL